MKISIDSDELKKRLKDYNPQVSSGVIPPIQDFDNSKLIEHFKQGMMKSEDIQKAYHLLMAADEVSKEMGISNVSVCQSGCANCCKIPVDVSQIEAQLISNNQSININDYSSIVKAKSKNSYCPFLDQNKAVCNIYEVRPLACRCFHTLDHYKYCATPNKKHLIVSVGSSPKWIQINKMLLTLSQQKVADIREWF